LPRWYLMTASQTEATLRYTRWPGLGRLPGRGGELRVGGDVPKENVGVEKQPHCPSNPRRTSSGSGASKSSETVNAPAQRPNGRRPDRAAGTGRNSATGRPPRATTMSSPAGPQAMLRKSGGASRPRRRRGSGPSRSQTALRRGIVAAARTRKRLCGAGGIAAVHPGGD